VYRVRLSGVLTDDATIRGYGIVRYGFGAAAEDGHGMPCPDTGWARSRLRPAGPGGDAENATSLIARRFDDAGFGGEAV
jgi:hypothetical protein